MQSGRRPGFISGTTTFSYVLILALPLSVSIRAIGETSVLTAGFGSWNSVANWNPASVPNSVGASAVFNGAATADNPAQAGNRTLTLDAAITVGSITVNNDLSTFTTTISTGTGGSLTFDAANGGPASINLPGGGGTGSATISAPMIFSDPVVATVNHVSSSSAAGDLNLSGAISGPGGFTKLGDGLATFGTGAKTYTGQTVVSGGRMRISIAAAPSGSSSVTVNTGGQLTPVTTGNYNFGPGSLALNGSGAFGGLFASFPGALRPDRGLDVVVSNAVVLQSDTVIHVQAAVGTGGNPVPSGSTTFAGQVSGPGKLTLTAPGSDGDIGSLYLQQANTYSGGSLVSGGRLVASGVAASFGAGNVTVDNSFSTLSIARLVIEGGATNAIADMAALSLGGGNSGMIELGAGINEIVGSLVLAGVAQPPGTYGSSSSSATFKNDTFFAGPGVITVLTIATPTQRLQRSTLDGGGGTSVRGAFSLGGTIGQLDAGNLASASRTLRGGFWAGIVLVQTPGTPVLKITTTSSNTAVISWPSPSAGFNLKQNSSLSSGTWSSPSEPVNDDGINKFIIVQPPAGNRFYRLSKP